MASSSTNSLIVDNTVIDYSTINNIVSIIGDLQKKVERLNGLVTFNKISTVTSDATGKITKDLFDIKIEALQDTFTVSKTTFQFDIKFSTSFAAPPTLNLSIQTTDTGSKPTMSFTQDAKDFQKITVQIDGLTPNKTYTVHALAIGY